jgi:uncharacterized delta-60 repeat protein
LGFVLLSALNAQVAGSLDNSFNTTGFRIEQLGTKDAYIFDIVSRKDGSILEGGFWNSSGDWNMAIRSVSSDGTTSGFLESGISSVWDCVLAMDMDMANDIPVAVGYYSDFSSETQKDLLIVSEKIPGGYKTYDYNLAAEEELHAVSVQADSRIVAAGFSFDSNFIIRPVIIRVFSDGTPDSSFNGTGVLLFEGDNEARFNTVSLYPDGRILAGGTEIIGFDSTRLFLLQLLPDGTPNPEFGINGFLYTSFGGKKDELNAVKLQEDGNIILAGTAQRESESDMSIRKLLKTGEPDTEFGNQGIATAQITDRDDKGSDMLIQPDGRFLLAGTVQEANEDILLARFYPDGSRDSSLGDSGIVITDLVGTDERVSSLGLDSIGRILVGGSATEIGTDEFGSPVAGFALTRFTNAPGPSQQTKDLSFPQKTSNSISLAFTPGNGESRLVFCFPVTSRMEMPRAETSYIGSSVFGNGSKIGPDGFCVMNGNESSVQVTNLLPETQYQFAVFEYAGNLGAEQYNFNINPQNFASHPTSAVLSSLVGEKKKEISVYPNPGKGEFTILLPPGKSEKMLVMTQDGRIIESIPIAQNQQQISYRNEKAGIYFIQLVNEAGIWHQTFIVLP